MTTIPFTKEQKGIISEIPSVGDDSAVYFYTSDSKSDAVLVSILEKLSSMSDPVLSRWLNITPRTFRNYKTNPDLVLKENTREHIILIISLYKHGVEVFGDVQNFESWLSKKNRLLDQKAPLEFLETGSGIKFIDNRLTAIEFGENV